MNDTEKGADGSQEGAHDEASRLWNAYARKKMSDEKASRPWLVVAIVVGLFVLLSGLYIVAFR